MTGGLTANVASLDRLDQPDLPVILVTGCTGNGLHWQRAALATGDSTGADALGLFARL